MNIKQYVKENLFAEQDKKEVQDVTVVSSGEADDMYMVTVTLPDGTKSEVASDVNQDEANEIKLAIQNDEHPEYRLQASGE